MTTTSILAARALMTFACLPRCGPVARRCLRALPHLTDDAAEYLTEWK